MMLKVAKLGIAIAAVVAMIVPAAFAGVPSQTNSYYVPEAINNSAVLVNGAGAAGNIASPDNAIFYMKTCPNNHSAGPLPNFGFLSNNARIRVVIKDNQPSGGVAIVGMPAADIGVMVNGGIGFGGMGADSIIANNSHPTTNGTGGFPLCPNVRFIQADGPTDATGTTYVTLTGSTPGSPGIATRDPNRKWGHFDAVMPVLALSFPLSGRKQDTDLVPNYTLTIRNVDHAGGLVVPPVVQDISEAVTAADLNVWQQQVGFNFANDIDGDGFKSAADKNSIQGHVGHDCNTPLDP